jgi:hypothetical protein
MPNPHAFYRFQNTWNAGFYPDNVVISNLLNEVYLFMGTWVPANAIGMTFTELKLEVKAIVAGYNSPTRLGEFVVTTQIIPDSPNYEFNINILNEDLAAVDSNQVVVINGFFNPTSKIVVSAAVYSFTPGSYTGTFSSAKIKTEDEVANALQIVNQNGSAFFPKTYLYNHGTGIATSGLARGSDWTLDANGESTQVPALTLPTTNARTFTMPALTPDERFIVSFMESIIGTSLSDISYLSIQDTYDSMDAPAGWTKSWAYNSVTYERIQIGFEGPNGRSFAMVGRLDGDWLWQRFVVNDATVSGIPNFLTTYIATAPLPYPTDGAAYYVYFSEWFDFDFVDFTSGCYESNEFYPMPAIPGDSLQFNIPMDDGNLNGLLSVDIGLFKQDGGFVKKIGSASNKYTISFVIPNNIPPFDPYYVGATLLVGVGNNIPADNLDYLPNFPRIYSSIPASPTAEEFAIYLTNSLKADYYYDSFYSYNGTNWVVKWVVYNYFTDALTVSSFDYVGSLSWGGGSVPDGFEFFLEGSNNCNTQFFASVIIPSVTTNCYRIGLYSETESDGNYLYSLSNSINIDASDCFSTIIEFWGNENSIAQGFEYNNDWKQRIRLGINGGGAKPIIEENVYRQSNGVHRRPQNKQDLSIDLHTDYIDFETQCALVDATRHPYFVWNNQSIFVNGDVEVATTQDFTTQSSFETLAQVKFQALVQGFQPKNSSCLTC